SLTYLQGYPEHLLAQVRALIAEQRLGAVLEKRYPGAHDYATESWRWFVVDFAASAFAPAPPELTHCQRCGRALPCRTSRLTGHQ
ncbi:hypothetical protein MJM45_30910, partial [Salmonella enterica subsp. enterica serovar Kentucky]|nr:hypothetical protein [Salmonella enterica subsp. enterica serovar Kentucky]